jgi:predicted transposase/invertase (TIGR01784 family)
MHRIRYPKFDLPIIYPLIFYNGATEYNESTELFDLFGKQKELAKSIFTEPFKLIDSQKIADEKLRQYSWAGILEFVMKHRFVADFLIYVEQVMEWLHRLELEANSFDYVRSVLKYIIHNLEGQNVSDLIAVAQQQLTPKMGETLMTFADQARQQGYEKGMNEGKTFADQARQQGYEKGMNEGKTFADQARQQTITQIAKKMLAQGFSVDAVVKVTGLPKTELERLILMEID